jgi:hypothetical protein
MMVVFVFSIHANRSFYSQLIARPKRFPFGRVSILVSRESHHFAFSFLPRLEF